MSALRGLATSSACAVFAWAAVACGGSSDVARPCDATTPRAAAPSLALCLSGALDGTLTSLDAATTACSALEPNAFRGTFYAPLGGVETRWEFSVAKGAGTFDLNAESAALVLDVSQASKERNWSSVLAGGRSGTITILPDRSGVLDVTLPERDVDMGGEVPGAPALRVRGTFRCPTEVG